MTFPGDGERGFIGGEAKVAVGGIAQRCGAAVEFVADRTTKRPFERSLRFAERITERAFANGLIVWPNVGNVDGRSGDLVIVAPPFTATEEELEEIVRRLDGTLKEMT